MTPLNENAPNELAGSRGVQSENQSNIQRNYRAATTANQRAIILKALRNTKDGLTTFGIRVGFDIPHPGARIMELRDRGYEIVTAWDEDSMPGGELHRVARYVLMPERQGRLFDD